MTYESKYHSEDLDQLFDAFLTLKSKEECYRLFEDLTTIQELKEFGQRFRVAKMLDEKVPYQKITELTGMSTATIARVNKSLIYGAEGYRLVLDRLKHK